MRARKVKSLFPPWRLWRQCCYLQLQILPEALRVNVLYVVFSCGSAHSLRGLVIWCHLIILHTSISIWGLVQCLTLRLYSGLHQKIGSLTFSAFNRYTAQALKGHFCFWRRKFFTNTPHPFRKAFCVTWKILVTYSKIQAIHPLKHFYFS